MQKRLTNEAKINEKEFCCKEIILLINDFESPLEYEQTRRAYRLVSIPRAFRKKNELTIGFGISYCPRCGKELPKDLSEEWLSIVEQAFAIDSMLDEKIDSLPQEYKTDEWWKNEDCKAKMKHKCIGLFT